MSIEKRNNILGDEELDVIAGGVDNQSKFEEINGSILEILPNSGFTVQLDNGEVIKAYTAGALRQYYNRIKAGDRVSVKRIASDGSNPRVTYVFKG